MGLIHLNAGVLIGALDADDAHHEAATASLARARVAGDRLEISASVAAEILVAPARHSARSADVVESFLDRVAIATVPVDRSIARSAAELRARHSSLRLPDALVIATAVARSAGQLITTDHRWPTRLGLNDPLEIVRL